MNWRTFRGTLAGGLVAAPLVALSATTTEAARRATKTIPIVMIAADPLVIGSITSVARPAENITGLPMMLPEVVAKQLELLKEVVPRISRVAVLGNPANPSNGSQLRQAELTARSHCNDERAPRCAPSTPSKDSSS